MSIRYPMTRPLNILLVSSEVYPFAKSGGLADVSGSLPAALKHKGHDVRIVLPKYRCVEQAKRSIRPKKVKLSVPIGDTTKTGSLHEARLHRTLPVYFIDQKHYFDREGLYGDAHGDFKDNAERYIFFCRAVLEACRALDFQPDIIHCNDWQTGLIPIYLKTLYAEDQFFENTRTIFSIHNLGYQGNFDAQVVPLAHLPWSVFTMEGAEFYDRFSFLKAGLVYADGLTTVSTTYCKEILTPEHGFGMDGILRHHQNKLHGVLNGADYKEWDPKTDSNINTRYGAGSLKGKQACKRSLMRKLSLKMAESTPLIGMVTRLSHQKGIDLLMQGLEDLMAEDVAVAILGSGEARYESFLEAQNQKYPGRFCYVQGFQEKLAHQLIAGCDILLMPSLYEPCGLTQMYALRYGTVPVVHRVGGLADTIKNFSPGKGQGTGFLFKPADSSRLLSCLKKALRLFDQKKDWRVVMRNGMKQDFSWDQAAELYLRRYRAVQKNT